MPNAHGWRSAVGDWVRRHPRQFWVAAFFCIWVLIALWRLEIVDSPPYWDSAMGLFLEANFLVDTNFDYRRLWFEEKRFVEGGAAIYLTSVLPTFIAVLMTVLPSPRAVFIAYHLFTFACAAGIAILICRILAPRVGLAGAAATAAATLTTPLVATQIDLLGMDLPMVACALAATWFILESRYLAGALAVVAAAALKMIGAIVGVGLVIYLSVATAVRYPTATNRWKRRLWVGLGTGSAALAAILVLVGWLAGQQTSQAESYAVDQQRGLTVMADLPYWCPDVLAITGLTFVGTLMYVGWRMIVALRQERGSISARAIAGAQGIVLDDPLYVFSWSVVLPMVMALSVSYTIPRYLSLPVAFVYLVAGALVFARPAMRPFGLVAFGAVVLFNLANADGRYFPQLPPEAQIDRRTGGILERSREYLADHRANIATVEYLVDNCASRPIIAGSPFVHFLSLPRLGYVTRPLWGVAVNTFTTPTFRSADSVPADVPENPVFVWVDNRFRQNALAPIPPPDATTRVLYTDEFPSSPAMVYELPRGTTPAESRQRVLAAIWPPRALQARAAQLARQGEQTAALAMQRQAVEQDPGNLPVRFDLARMLAVAGQFDEALSELEAIASRLPRDTAPMKLRAEIYVGQKRWAEAERQLRDALAIDANDVQLREMLGNLLLAGNRPDEALAEFVELARLAPDRPVGQVLQSQALARLGRFDQAEALAEKAVTLDPDNPEALVQLGELIERRGRLLRLGDPKQYQLMSRAVDLYRRAYERRPTSVTVLNHLAWLLATSPVPHERNGTFAVTCAEAMCKAVSRPTAAMQDTLAASYAAAGRFSDAVVAESKAVELAIAAGDDDSARHYTRRLELYRAGKPYTGEPVLPVP